VQQSTYLNLDDALKDKANSMMRSPPTGKPTHSISLNPEAYSNLGVALMAQGKMEKAIAADRSAIALRLYHSKIHFNLGRALHTQGNVEGAIAAFGSAIAERPNYPVAYLSLGNALREKHRFEEAIAAYRQAIAHQPDYPQAYLNLANIFHERDKIEEAVAAYSRAIALKPDFIDAHSNLGNALRKQGKIEEAISACRRAIAIQPDFPAAHLNLSLALLLRGDLEEGWHEYEWRWKGGSNDLIPRNLIRPRWQGEGLIGKTLLLHAEQGLGDTLQFARFAPVMASRAAKIILAVQPPLVSLLSEARWSNVTVNNGVGFAIWRGSRWASAQVGPVSLAPASECSAVLYGSPIVSAAAAGRLSICVPCTSHERTARDFEGRGWLLSTTRT
jgi:tetratricopeptide (TPR) repeat protein